MPGQPDPFQDNVCTLSNGDIEAVVSLSFGPRVLRFGRPGHLNVFSQPSSQPIETRLGPWQPRGGHRLWVAPESMPGSYAPDDEPVHVERHGSGGATFRQPVDQAGVEKQLTVSLDARGMRATVRHRITNRLYWPIEVAPWGITAVRPDGVAVIPQPPFRPHPDDLLPARPLVQWSFTDLTDARWSLGARLIRLSAHHARPSPQKLGVGNREGWCALLLGDHVFFKAVAWQEGQRYPDYGCNNEVFAAGEYLELETLGPLTVLTPGASVDHEERWALASDVQLPVDEERLAEVLATLAARHLGDAAV